MSAFEEALRLDPGNDLVLAYVGLTEMAGGELEPGFDKLEGRIAVTNPACQARVLLLAERFLSKHGESGRSLEQQLQDGQSIGSENRPARGVDKVLTYLWHALAKALVSLRYLGNPDKRLARISFLDGSLRCDLGQREKAAAAFETSMRLEPDRCLTRLRLADLELDSDPEAALDWLAGIDSDLGGWKTTKLEICSLAQYRAGQYSEAVEGFNELARLDKLDYRFPYYLGLCQLALQDERAAVLAFEKANTRLNPKIAYRRLQEMIRVARIPDA